MPDFSEDDLNWVNLRADWWRSRRHRAPIGRRLSELHEALAVALKRAERENTVSAWDAVAEAASAYSAAARAAPGALPAAPADSPFLKCLAFVSAEARRLREFAEEG